MSHSQGTKVTLETCSVSRPCTAQWNLSKQISISNFCGDFHRNHTSLPATNLKACQSIRPTQEDRLKICMN